VLPCAKNRHDVRSMLDAMVDNLNENRSSLIVKLIALFFFIDPVCRSDMINHIYKRFANLSGIDSHFG
jgi:hypothetical protein